MAQALRIEFTEHTSFITTRTVDSRLWFHKNNKIKKLVLAFLAKYQKKYGVKIYFFVFLGNHYHLGADFPRRNRAAFMRDFNSIISKLTRFHVRGVPAGPLWQTRYRCQAIVRDEDRENYFFYAALNPVSSGLVERISDYKNFGYDFFFDAMSAFARKYKLIDWRSYRDKKRFNKNLRPKDFEKTYTLEYTRLPGYENLSQAEYVNTLTKKLEERRQQIIKARYFEGKGFAGIKALLSIKSGDKPKSTKTNKKYERQPLVLTSCAKTKKEFKCQYRTIRERFTFAYLSIKDGKENVSFPTGTYRPPLIWCVV